MDWAELSESADLIVWVSQKDISVGNFCFVYQFAEKLGENMKKK